MKSRIVSFCTALAVMAVVWGLAGCTAGDPEDNSGKKDEGGPAGIPVTGISLKKSSLTLPVGNSERLEYTLIPENATNKQVSWSSDSTSTASVSQNGTVSFLTEGDAEITVTTADGGFTATITVTVGPPQPVTGILLEKDSLTLTMFAQDQLNYTLVPATASNKKVTWTSSAPDVVRVVSDGTVTALSYTTGGTSTVSSEATGTAIITVKTEDGDFTDTITITTTMEGQVDIMDLPSLKEQFDGYFMIGNIFDPPGAWYAGDISAEAPYVVNNDRLLRHYNVLTPQNNMKPQYMSTATRGVYNETNIATADRMVNAARASGFQVVGHTLLWHSQNATWMNDLRTDNTTSREDALEWMKEYVTYIADHFKGRIYIWDVLNEAFPDGVSATADWKTSMRSGAQGNPWFMKLGADFVYEGFLAARLADPNAILYYNDYSLDNAGKATMVRDMVRDVNLRYAEAYPDASRLLIEGIGMQSHHNTGVSANSVKNTLNLFRPLGVKISISEMDVLSQSWNDYDSNQATPTNAGKLQAANLYGELFKLFVQNVDIIERVSFWGIADNRSWRGRGLPLLFDANGKAKPAYYKAIGALE